MVWLLVRVTLQVDLKNFKLTYMSTTGKDEKVVTTEVQSQQGGQDSQNASKKDLYANDPIAQRIAKGKELRDKIGETISTPIQKEEPFDYDQAYKDAKNEVDMTRSLHDAEREGEERRQNNRRIMTAIGDGLSGLANIYFTSQGTPDLLKGAPSLTGKMQERYDKMRKDAETRRANYLKVVQEGADQKVKDMYTRYKDDVAQRNKEKELSIKEERVKKDAMLAEAKAMYYTNKADTEGYLAMEKAIEAGNYDEFFRLKMKNLEADTKKKEADANKPSKSSSGGGSGRSSSKSKQDSQTVTENEYKDGKKVRSVRTTTYGNQSKNQKQKPTGNRASQISYRKNK